MNILFPDECISKIVSTPSTGNRDKRKKKLLEFTSGNTMVEERLEA